MVRVKRGNVARKRRQKIINFSQGYKGTHSTLFRLANQQVMKALNYAYRGRKQKKRIFRQIWISRINAASRINGLTYSKFIAKLTNLKVGLNRKMLAQLAILDSSTFTTILNCD